MGVQGQDAVLEADAKRLASPPHSSHACVCSTGVASCRARDRERCRLPEARLPEALWLVAPVG